MVGHTVLFILHDSVECTVKYLSLFYLLLISWFVFTGRWCIDKLGTFHASQLPICLDPTTYLFRSIWEIKVRLVWSNMLKHSSNFLTGRSKVVLLLWILLLSVSYLSVILSAPFNLVGHLLGKNWPLCSYVCDVFLWFCHFPICCPGSGVAFDCIDSWSLPSSLLCLT